MRLVPPKLPVVSKRSFALACATSCCKFRPLGIVLVLILRFRYVPTLVLDLAVLSLSGFVTFHLSGGPPRRVLVVARWRPTEIAEP